MTNIEQERADEDAASQLDGLTAGLINFSDPSFKHLNWKLSDLYPRNLLEKDATVWRCKSCRDSNFPDKHLALKPRQTDVVHSPGESPEGWKVKVVIDLIYGISNITAHFHGHQHLVQIADVPQTIFLPIEKVANTSTKNSSFNINILTTDYAICSVPADVLLEVYHSSGVALLFLGLVYFLFGRILRRKIEPIERFPVSFVPSLAIVTDTVQNTRKDSDLICAGSMQPIEKTTSVSLSMTNVVLNTEIGTV
jgi:hypothetical protein